MMTSQKGAQCLCGKIAVTEDLRDDPGAQRFAGVGWYHGGAPIGMAEKVVAALHANNSKPGRSERRNEVGTGETR
jgi:hypothetical protein